MVAEMRIDKRLRIRVMNQLLAREPELPNATAWLEKWKKELKAEDENERETEEAEFTAAMNRMGIEVLDEKSKRAKRRRSKEERERRKREGKCVDCPSDDDTAPALQRGRRDVGGAALEAAGAGRELSRETEEGEREEGRGSHDERKGSANEGDVARSRRMNTKACRARARERRAATKWLNKSSDGTKRRSKSRCCRS